MRKSPCAPRVAVARPRREVRAGRFDRSLVPLNLSDPLAALRSDRRNRLLMCEAAFSCYDNVSGTGGTWSMTGRAASKRKNLTQAVTERHDFISVTGGERVSFTHAANLNN